MTGSPPCRAVEAVRAASTRRLGEHHMTDERTCAATAPRACTASELPPVVFLTDPHARVIA
jgi:hypothetical protein